GSDSRSLSRRRRDSRCGNRHVQADSVSDAESSGAQEHTIQTAEPPLPRAGEGATWRLSGRAQFLAASRTSEGNAGSSPSRNSSLLLVIRLVPASTSSQ